MPNSEININKFFENLATLSQKWEELSKLKDSLADEFSVKWEYKKELESESRMLYNCARELKTVIKIFEALKNDEKR